MARAAGIGMFGGVQAKRRFNSALVGDVKRMEDGALGLSRNEKGRIAEGAQMAAGAQAAAQTADAQRQSMATGASPFVGHAAQLQRDIGQQAQETAAQAAVGADELSQGLAAAEKADIMARLERQRERQKQVSAGTQKMLGGAAAAFLGGGGGEALSGFLKK